MDALKKLHDLVHSLNIAEKKFIKTHIKRVDGAASNYNTLYTIINKKTVYDKEYILKQIDKKEIEKNRNYLQNYLYDFLLDTIRLQRIDTDIELLVKSKIQDAKFLTNRKGLHTQAELITLKALKLANKYDFFDLEKECIRLLLALMYNSTVKKSIEQKKHSLLDKRKIVEQKILILNKIANKLKQGRQYFSYGQKRRDKETFLKYKDLYIEFSDQELQFINSNYKLKSHFLEMQAIQCFFLGDYAKNLALSNQILDLAQQNDSIIQIFPKNLIKAHFNCCISLWNNQIYTEEMILHVDKMNRASQIYSNYEYEHYYDTSSLQILLRYHIANKNKDEFIPLFNKLEESVNNLKNKKNYGYGYYSHTKGLPYTCFLIGDYEKLSYWLNEFLNISQTKIFNEKDRIRLKVIEIIYHYEIENYTLIPSLLLSLERLIKKTDRMFGLEKWVLNTFKNKNIYIASMKKEFLKKRLRALEKVCEDPFEKIELYEESRWDLWLKSKIKGTKVYEEF